MNVKYLGGGIQRGSDSNEVKNVCIVDLDKDFIPCLTTRLWNKDNNASLNDIITKVRSIHNDVIRKNAELVNSLKFVDIGCHYFVSFVNGLFSVWLAVGCRFFFVFLLVSWILVSIPCKTNIHLIKNNTLLQKSYWGPSLWGMNGCLL